MTSALVGACSQTVGRGEWRDGGGARDGDPRPVIGGIEEVSARYDQLVRQAVIGPYVVKPQEVWGWQIAGYLYLGGLGAGAFAVAVILDWLGFSLAPMFASPVGDWVWDWSKALVLWGPLAAGIGAALLILDLGRNRMRFLTAGNNPRTSWMARGFGILLSFIVAAGAVVAVSVLAPEWRLSVLAPWRFVEAVAVMAAFGTAVYTGILLRSMTYIVAWNAPLIPPLFLTSALSTGAMGVVIGSLFAPIFGGDPRTAERLVHAIEVFEPIVIMVEAGLLVSYIRSLVGGRPEAVWSARILLRGAWRYTFWIGVVGCALVLPFALSAVNIGVGSGALAAVSASSVLVGGLALRLVVLGIGVKERPPLYKLGEWRLQHVLKTGA